MTKLRLYHYWRSSSSWRVRWAMSLKKVECDWVSINLLSDEPESETHLKRNPLGYVPVLEFVEESAPFKYMSESMAIIHWLEETYPTPSLLPGDRFQRARIIQLAEIINSGTQPLQNPNVSTFHSSDPNQQKNWNHHWIKKGLAAYETLVQSSAAEFSVGNTITLADLFLIPQCYNALRQEISLSDYPTLERIYLSARKTENCIASSPEKFQPM